MITNRIISVYMIFTHAKQAFFTKLDHEYVSAMAANREQNKTNTNYVNVSRAIQFLERMSSAKGFRQRIRKDFDEKNTFYQYNRPFS